MNNPDFKGVRGLIFDYGGTIDSRSEHWSRIIARAYAAAGVTLDDATFRDAYVFGERRLAAERLVLPGDNFRRLMYVKALAEIDRLVQLGALAPDTEADRLASSVADYCYEHARRCIDSARAAVGRLADSFPSVLVSNFYGNIDTVLCDFGLRHLFRGIIESSVVGVRKPDPRIFMLGAVALGLRPDEVMVIGDSLTKDILPAESAGFRTAWIKGPGWSADEDNASHRSETASLEALAKAIF